MVELTFTILRLYKVEVAKTVFTTSHLTREVSFEKNLLYRIGILTRTSVILLLKQEERFIVHRMFSFSLNRKKKKKKKKELLVIIRFSHQGAQIKLKCNQDQCEERWDCWHPAWRSSANESSFFFSLSSFSVFLRYRSFYLPYRESYYYVRSHMRAL